MTSEVTVVLEGRIRRRTDTPPSQELAMIGDRIGAVDDGVRKRADVRWELPGSATVLPAFRDPHLHLASMAAERLSTDCSVSKAPDIPTLLETLREAAADVPPGSWVRGFGFDESLIEERRAPTLDELDAVAPDQPLLLRHRAGYEAFVNSSALASLSEVRATGRSSRVLPPGSVGTPDGHLIDLDGRTHLGLPAFDRSSLETAVAEVSRELAASGVAAMTDAGAKNDVDRAQWLSSLVDQGTILQRVEVMIGGSAIDEARSEGLQWGTDWNGVRIGHAKVIPSSNAGTEEQIESALRANWPVAVHVTSIEQLGVTLKSLRPHNGTDSSRVEHLSMALPEQLDELAKLGCVVVTQPLFPRERMRKYEEVFEPTELGWLYPVASLLRRGISFAFSSDAPVGRPEPLDWMRSAVGRGPLTDGGSDAGEGISLDTAIKATTGLAGGSTTLLHDGDSADLVVLSDDPLEVELEEHGNIVVLATFRAGELIYAADGLPLPEMYTRSPADGR